MAKQKSDFFPYEKEVLRRSREQLGNSDVNLDLLREGYSKLCDEYEKLVEEATFLTKQSDRLEAKLSKANEELNSANTQLNEQNQNLSVEKDKAVKKGSKLMQEVKSQEQSRSKLQMTLLIIVALLIIIIILFFYYFFVRQETAGAVGSVMEYLPGLAAEHIGFA